MYLYGLGVALLVIAEAISVPWLNWPSAAAMVAALLYALWTAMRRIFLGARDDLAHVSRHGLAQESEPPRWMNLPFAGEFLVAMYVLSLTPIGLSIQHAARGQWPQSAGFAALWLLVFPLVALNLHRRRLIHIAVSAFAAVAAMLAFPLALLLLD